MMCLPSSRQYRYCWLPHLAPCSTCTDSDVHLLSTGTLQSLLCDPNPNSPANSEAARLYGENRRAHPGAAVP